MSQNIIDSITPVFREVFDAPSLIVTKELSANDVEGDEFTFSFPELSIIPASLNLESATLSGTPLNEDVGGQTISIVVSDASASDTVSFVLTVENVNDEPAVSLHVYAKPFGQCDIYDLDDGIIRRLELTSDSMYKKPCN